MGNIFTDSGVNVSFHEKDGHLDSSNEDDSFNDIGSSDILTTKHYLSDSSEQSEEKILIEKYI